VTPIPPPEPIEVTAPDVAAWLRARTKDSEGREVGLWNEDTRPTLGQVETHIDQARALVELRIGSSVPDPFVNAYRYVVALQAACIIEKQYWPEQIRSGLSNYPELLAEYDAAMQLLENAVLGQKGAHDAYSLCTPFEPCGCGPGLWAPANWNDPYANDPDRPVGRELNDPAVQWLKAHQAQWAGQPMT